LIHQDDYEKTKEFYDQLKKGVLIQTELDFRFYNSLDQDDPQNMKWVGIIATPIEYQDRDAILAITIDLTESKELERLLTVQDKMASLGHVSAGIAHEIRNPLSGININLRTIEKSYKKPAKSEKVEQSIQAIRSASKKIESVIRRVMNFAKPSEPRFDLIDINKPIIEAIELSNYTLKKNNVNLELSLGDSLPKCFAEPQLIEEVVLNLINNAADEIKCVKPEKIIRISSYENNNKVCVSVEDNGPGIKRDLREKIFEPFFTTKEYSTGIGLSICHRIITDHKGVLRVGISELGGANFVIEIPFSNHLN
jgi:C4-dicarboxylate-specific signal transduction histidine kinase